MPTVTDLERSLMQRVGELEAELLAATQRDNVRAEVATAQAERISYLEAELWQSRDVITSTSAAAERQAGELARVTAAYQQCGRDADELRRQRNELLIRVGQQGGDLENAHRDNATQRQRIADLEAAHTNLLRNAETLADKLDLAQAEPVAAADAPVTVRDAINWLHYNGMHAAADGLTRQFNVPAATAANTGAEQTR